LRCVSSATDSVPLNQPKGKSKTTTLINMLIRMPDVFIHERTVRNNGYQTYHLPVSKLCLIPNFLFFSFVAENEDSADNKWFMLTKQNFNESTLLKLLAFRFQMTYA
jgi:hypothetical protein